jgi:hypothetical protein
VRNAYDPAKHPEGAHGLHTAKENRQKHGYGTKIIQGIAAKYHGYADYRTENGFFLASVMLEASPRDDAATGAKKAAS